MSSPRLPASPERDLPEPLDQKMVTWEAVQKESYLSKLERSRRDSETEVLRRTAHRCPGRRGLGAEITLGRSGHRGLSAAWSRGPLLSGRAGTLRLAERHGLWRGLEGSAPAS